MWEIVTFLTKAVYCDMPIPPQFKYKKINKPSGLNGIYIDCGEFDLVIFRGTNSFRDWITNAKMIFGIPKQFEEALEFTRENVKEDKKLIITGHSLGGAIVQYVSNEIDHHNLLAITYNPAGIKHLVEPKYDFLLYNFITKKDILNRITRALPWNFFKNLGISFWIDDNLSKNGIESHSNFQVFIDYDTSFIPDLN